VLGVARLPTTALIRCRLPCKQEKSGNGKADECGAFYGKRKPDVNMCLPPLASQTYDVEIKELDGNVVATVWHNGVMVHENFVLKKGPIKPATIHLQNHGNPVAYRNIWFAEKK
jgi:hypothetical protein